MPAALVPLEDQGFFIAASLLPDGASLHRTHEHAKRVEELLLADPAIEHVATINGFDFVGGGSNSAVSTMFVMLKGWHLRTAPGLDIDSTIGRFYGATMGMKEALVFAFNPPPIQGLGLTGGFEVYLQNRGEGDTARLAQVAHEFIAKLNQDARLLGVRTLFRADSPQILLTLDRAKAKSLGVGVDEVFTTLQAAFGSLYVNDFDRAGRVYRVEIAVPLMDYGTLACSIQTTDTERAYTAQVIRDLRVPLYDTRLMLLRDCQNTKNLLKTYQAERSLGNGSDLLAFLRSLYQVKPFILALPPTWFNVRN